MAQAALSWWEVLQTPFLAQSSEMSVTASEDDDVSYIMQ